DWLFATLEGNFAFPEDWDGSFQLSNIPPLFIEKQPEGGFISFDGGESVTLSVEVSGGEKPYTYEWHMKDHTYDSVMDNDALAAAGSDTDKLSDWGSTWESLFGGLDLDLIGENTPQVDVSSEIVGTDSPVLYADKGICEYWCKITDNAGQKIETESAYVNYKVHIIEQPHNVNLTGVETAVLTCKAAGGYEENGYTYTWHDQYGIEVGTGPEFAWDLEGEYYCVASDGVDTVYSDNAVLYYADRLRIRNLRGGGDRYWPEEEGKLIATVSGGVPPYEAVWTDNLPTSEGTVVGKYTIFTGVSSAAGDYTFTVTDSMGERMERTVTRRDRQLTITRQPESGVIPGGGKLPIGVEVYPEDAVLPIDYALFKDGEHLIGETQNAYSDSFDMDEPGIYQYVITDALGHKATSNYAVLKVEEFRVVDQTQSAELKSPTDMVTLSVEVTGGTPPYEYQWFRQGFSSWKELEGEDASSLSGYPFGTYACRIMDAKYCIWSEPISVKYAGEKPLILMQPSSIVLKPGQNGYTLSCYAISGTGDNSGIIYAWYYWQKSNNLIPGLGEWKPMSVEKNGRVTAYGTGMYRCMVTDMTTGKHTWSNIAGASEELVFVGVKETMTFSDASRFELSFKGGCAPYTVTLFIRWAEWKNNTLDYSYRVFFTDTINSAAELAQLEYDLRYNFLLPAPSGRFDYINARYQVVVTDALGNKCESTDFTHGMKDN
ncbi:MAG: hypothetical protein J6U72_00135, partial [Clostridia bacterium]|nr:hypothetical protein [Clostridia bacterium]